MYLSHTVRSQRGTNEVLVGAVETKEGSLVFKGLNEMGNFTEISAELDEPLVVDGRIHKVGEWPHQTDKKGSLVN